MLSENTLTAFLLLADIGSFQDAARKMGVSNASLSRYIAQAEEQTGFNLFHRHRNKSKLTRAGQKFLIVAKRLKSDLEHYERQVEQLRMTGVGTLRIGCGPLTTRTLIQPLLRHVLQHIPDLRFQIAVSAHVEPLDLLQSGTIDIFIGDLTHTPHSDNVEILVVKKQPVEFVAHPSHEIHNHGTCTLAQIFEHPFASPHLHKHWRATLIQALGNNREAIEKVAVLPQIESDDYGLLTGLLSTPEFIVGGMRETFAEQIALGTALKINVRAPIAWNICAARKKTEKSPALDLFWKQLVAINTGFE
jgi:DNA-binding transcriptional LysR family regulator